MTVSFATMSSTVIVTFEIISLTDFAPASPVVTFTRGLDEDDEDEDEDHDEDEDNEGEEEEEEEKEEGGGGGKAMTAKRGF